MKNCSNCQSIHVIHMSSLHTRILLSIYIFLNFYFFTGAIDYGALISLIPFLIPYLYKCTDCKTTFFGMPRVNLKNFWVGNNPDKYLLAMLPTILAITLLILNFPNTGLERIVYLPTTYLLNSVIILLFLYKFSKYIGTMKFISWVLLIVVTVIVSVVTYPQEYGDGILRKIFTQ